MTGMGWDKDKMEKSRANMGVPTMDGSICMHAH